ncbi:hypothetical protein [Ferrimonas senticii]|uniref:hypothetical protein n=1 Tax=Ferrimonas senticii TaxID=394566 RepID=UPI000423C7A2|nr:hypothetical protein [Ferrimonas senticii]
MKRLNSVIALLLLMWVAGCGTSDDSLRQQGHNEAYIQGFHDGRHSGMKRAGNNFEHYLRDEQRFNNDRQYQQGWQAGEQEGIRLQQQAKAIGTGAAAAMPTTNSSSVDPDAIADEVLKEVDTSTLKGLQ